MSRRDCLLRVIEKHMNDAIRRRIVPGPFDGVLPDGTRLPERILDSICIEKAELDSSPGEICRRLKADAGRVLAARTSQLHAHRLAEPIGQARGWADLTAGSEPRIDDLLILLQHAEAKPLRMSVDRVIAFSTDSLVYDAMTFGGASGAPCLTGELAVVAIHSQEFLSPEGQWHKGGVRTSAIASDIAVQGVSLSSPTK